MRNQVGWIWLWIEFGGPRRSELFRLLGSAGQVFQLGKLGRHGCTISGYCLIRGLRRLQARWSW